ncbi:MAG TPA: gliding motility-associated C-terminal domain-containing protein, partial [Bacteroidia bacterium]|nr:gliding motility-associated C-terminal domain-containing protein [Bacteroidia bacterium]
VLTKNIKTDIGEFTFSGINKKEDGSVNAKPDSLLWITNPAFKVYNAMYDLCYDNKGNLYVYGGEGPYQLAKIDSTGALKWIYNVNFVNSDGNELYGDFVTDRTTGTSYLGESINDTSGPEIIKVNSAGIVLGSTFLGADMTEAWRMDMNYCTHKVIIAGGGVISTDQTAIIDTSLSGINLFNVALVSDGKHDMALLTADREQPDCYMACTNPNDLRPGPGNVLIKCAIPSLAPPAYMVLDNCSFEEIKSNAYVDEAPSGFQGSAANGMNGIVATINNIYTWDGTLITRYNKSNGSFISAKRIHPVVFGLDGQEIITCGGIDADNCGNIYLGDNSSIDILDTNLNTTSVIPLSGLGDTIYDLHISTMGKLYACGYGFITSYSIPQIKNSIVKTASPACTGCNGTAFASLSGCGTGEYLWSTGSTQQYITNLCAGTYTVSIRVDCSTVLTDTVVIPPSSNPSVDIPGADVKDVSCFGDSNGSAIAITSNGTLPYTYLWYPLNSSSDTITNLAAGTYTFIVTDANGCAAIQTVTITQPAMLRVSATANGAIHIEQTAALTASAAGGTPPYTYNWSDSAGSSATVNVSPGSTTNYTVTVTDKDGCTATAIVTVEVLCDDIFVPDAFSPNGDGYNDYLYVKGGCITNMTFLVFDRWGNKVFETSNLNNGWNGNYNGHPMNTGTYAWYLKVTLKDQTSVERKGNVTLIR